MLCIEHKKITKNNITTNTNTNTRTETQPTKQKRRNTTKPTNH